MELGPPSLCSPVAPLSVRFSCLQVLTSEAGGDLFGKVSVECVCIHSVLPVTPLTVRFSSFFIC
jgi:hypothetical protein